MLSLRSCTRFSPSAVTPSLSLEGNSRILGNLRWPLPPKDRAAPPSRFVAIADRQSEMQSALSTPLSSGGGGGLNRSKPITDPNQYDTTQPCRELWAIWACHSPGELIFILGFWDFGIWTCWAAGAEKPHTERFQQRSCRPTREVVRMVVRPFRPH